jgi:hypothetical protein
VGLADISELPGSDFDHPTIETDRLGLCDETSGYDPGLQEGDGMSRLWVAVSQTFAETDPDYPKDRSNPPEWTVTFTNPIFTLHFKDGNDEQVHDLTVYLPTLAFLNTGTWGGWVALDGSVYYADNEHWDSVNCVYPAFTQCADFAMAYAPPVIASENSALAMSQRTGASQATPVNSPLVDAGSRDFWNDGWTDVHIGNLVYRDNPNNDDVFDMMDIGFHYRGSMRHPIETVTGVAMPRIVGRGTSGGSPPTTWPLWSIVGTAAPEVDDVRQIALISSEWDDSVVPVRDETVCFFPTEEYDPDDQGSYSDYDVRLIGCAFFRAEARTGEADGTFVDAYLSALYTAGALAQRTLDDDGSSGGSESTLSAPLERIAAIDACTVPARDSATNTDEVYVAAVVDYSISGGGSLSDILVWRLDHQTAYVDYLPDGDSNGPGGLGDYIGWRKPVSWDDGDLHCIRDVAICANSDDGDENLWVFWIEELDGVELIKGYTIDSPSTVSTPDDFSRVLGSGEPTGVITLDGDAGSGHQSVAFYNWEVMGEEELGNYIEADFDFDISSGVPPSIGGQPRISYLDYDDSTGNLTVLGPVEVRLSTDSAGVLSPTLADRVFLPDEWDDGETFSSAEDQGPVAFSCNQSDASGLRAFAAYELDIETTTQEVYNLWEHSVSTSGTTDTWDDACAFEGHPLSSVSATNLQHPDVSYRFSGSAMEIMAVDLSGSTDAVATNADSLIDGVTNHPVGQYHPRITTNGTTRVDVMAVYGVGTDGSGHTDEIRFMALDP